MYTKPSAIWLKKINKPRETKHTHAELKDPHHLLIVVSLESGWKKQHSRALNP